MTVKEIDRKTEDLRSAIEHRATWCYCLVEEALKRGLDTDFAHQAIYRCGQFHGHMKFPQTNDLREFSRAFANENVQKIFEMEILKNDGKEFSVAFHYCPLVAAWRKLTNDPDKIATLCSIAMAGDRGIISRFESFEFHLGKTIASGGDHCEIRIRKTEKNKPDTIA